MNVEGAILARRSVRSYKKDDISKEKLKEILNVVRMAPSANNRQDWKFVIVSNETKKEKIYEVANRQGFVKEAAAVIAGITTDPKNLMTCGVPAGVVDLSIALDHLTLKAAEEGLGTCWIGAFDQEGAKKVLGVPENNRIIALMSIGYPRNSLERREKSRKGLEDIISFDGFFE